MSVIAEVQLAGDFALSELLRGLPDVRMQLERVIPAGNRTIPLIWIHAADPEPAEQELRDHHLIKSVTQLDTFEDRALYRIEWEEEPDSVFKEIRTQRAALLDAVGGGESWEFELRFPSHEALSDFQRYCNQEQIAISVRRIYNPTKPGTGPWFGLTPMQRETLLLATEMGYYDIPRECSTIDLAERLEISDQAVTERLRRAIVTLVSNTLHEEQTTSTQEINERLT